MKKKFITFFLLLLFQTIPYQLFAACNDAPGDGVNYENCQFADGQDLSASYLPNSNLILTSFIKVNFDKSVIMASNLSNGNFAESSFFRANLYESVLDGGNFEKANFESSNLIRVSFKGASLIETNFKNSNLFGADFTGANILNANFEGSNLNSVTWSDGSKCKLDSIGACKWAAIIGDTLTPFGLVTEE